MVGDLNQPDDITQSVNHGEEEGRMGAFNFWLNTCCVDAH